MSEQEGEDGGDLVISYRAHLAELNKVRQEEKLIFAEQLSTLRREIETQHLKELECVRAEALLQAKATTTPTEGSSLRCEVLIDALFATRPEEKRDEWKRKLDAAEARSTLSML